MSTKRDRMYERIEKHGEKLLILFPNASERDPIKLSKKAFALEAFAHSTETDYCNGERQASIEKREAQTRKRFAKLFGVPLEGPYFINGDPRGYTLKVKDSAMHDLPRDWGGYGIIAPDLTND